MNGDSPLARSGDSLIKTQIFLWLKRLLHPNMTERLNTTGGYNDKSLGKLCAYIYNTHIHQVSIVILRFSVHLPVYISEILWTKAFFTHSLCLSVYSWAFLPVKASTFYVCGHIYMHAILVQAHDEAYFFQQSVDIAFCGSPVSIQGYTTRFSLLFTHNLLVGENSISTK